MASKIMCNKPLDKSNKISVIIPVYKVEPYLRQCVDSVVGQTYKNLEIILIDDGSPDNCGVICDEYAEWDERVFVIHKQNGGLSNARNDGIMAATGKWLAFLDSDDWIEVDYYEKLLVAVEMGNPDIIISGCYWKEYPHKRKSVRNFNRPAFYNDREHILEFQANIIRTGMPWDKLYKTDFIKKQGFMFDTSINAFEDFLFNFQVYEKAESVAVCPVNGYHYRQMTESITSSFNPAKPQITYQYLTKLHEYAASYGTGEKQQSGVNACAIQAIHVAMNCYFFHPANTKKHSEVNRELMQMFSLPYYQEAINSKSNRYLSRKQVILKYAARSSRGGVLRMIHAAKKKFTM